MNTSNRGSLQKVILDEIALEGLEGIILESLWVYLSKSLNISQPLAKQLKENVWKFILDVQQHLQFFEIPEERSTVKLFDRYQCVDNDLGIPLSPEECPFVRYKCVPISDGNVIGSCQYYKERKLISFSELKNLNVETVQERWGNKFVIVASQELRYNALTPENVTRLKELTPIQYCIWEAIGRSRYNGETTSGLWSLTHFCKDPTIVFYIKNKLIRHGVVTHQLFNEKRSDRLIVTTLLTLPRFFPSYRSILISMVEKLFIMLKEKPDFSMPLVEARVHFPSFEKQKTFKKAMLTHIFRKIFETHSLPYYDIYPNPKGKKTHANGRTVTIVKLRHPEKSIDDIFESIENEQEKNEENTDGDFHNEKHAYVDMPLREEFYRCVSRFGNRGCSQTEIYRHLSINHLSLRQLIKKMSMEGLIKSYCVDVGRQRTNMYVAVECFDSVNKTVKDSLDVLQNLQCAEEPKIPQVEALFPDVSQITARVKNYDFPLNTLIQRNENISQRLISRKAFAVKMIDEYGIISVLHLRKLLLEHEKAKGLKDEVCQKSLKRILHHMSQSNIIRMYEIILQKEENIRIYRYVTHPKIDIDHIALKNEILKLKNSLFLLLEEKRHKSLNLPRNQLRKLKNSKKSKSSESKLIKSTLIPMKSHKPPKFLISRYMHEFLFYIVVELNECQIPLDVTKDLLQTWQISEPSLRIDQYLAQLEPEYTSMKAYTKYISWRTFIPPLPRYSDKPAGWVYFIDAVDRMPLSIFNKIFRIDKGADERLTAFLNHPIRQHYLMRQLPSDLQCKISRVQLQRVYISVLKLLNHMGLIQAQTSERLSIKDPLVMWIYLNRRAKVLDTTNSEAGYKHINSEREYTPITFDLCSFDDIHNYWTTLQRICVYTKLGFRSRSKGRSERIKELNFVNSVDFDEAPLHDSGYLPGDGLGAAGLSTNLFAHTFRNWSWYVHGSNKVTVKNIRTGRPGSSGVRGTSKVVRVISRKSRQSQTVAMVKRSSTQFSSSTNKRLKKTAPRDAVDRDALKNMRTLRVSWSKAEDEMLMIGKAASAYIAAPVPALGLLTIGKSCRDAIRHSLGIFNKTTQACCRRLQFMVRQKRHIPQVPTWLHTLQTDEHLQKKYGENFLQRLKKVYPVRSEFCDALAIHYTLVMCYLFKFLHNTYDSKTKSRFILPDSIQEFHKRFLERMPVQIDEDSIIYKNPETDFDLQTIVVESVLHSSLCAMRDKTLYNLQAFEIYKSYSEEVLEAAFSKARSDGLAVAIKRKNISLLPNHLSGPAYVLSSKYKLKLIFLRIPYGIYDAFYNYFDDTLNALFQNKRSKIISSEYLELKSPTPAQMFVIGEGLARNMWSISIKLPINILTVDAEQNQTNISSMDRILDHYQSIFDNAPQQEYSKIIENSGQNEKQARVKFHPANLSYKIHYSPYDFISKLQSRYLHFFCALDFLEKEVEINFSKLQRKDDDGHLVIECPFKCIFESGDYVAEISRIVEEKKDILSSLTEMAPQKLLNLATSGLSMKVYNSNILTLVRMLESYWHEKELKYERTDLGKYMTNLKCSKSIDWCQLCNDILMFNANSDDFEKSEEYEPTLNKEERVIRAQDVFVVNLPTIQIKFNDELLNDKNTICYKKELNIPKRILESDLLRESILKKIHQESLWKYTENSLDNIKEKLDNLGFNEMQQKHLEEIHNFIERHTLGVSISHLMIEFPYENFLFKALNLLSYEFIIKRVGISSFMYVHKNHIRPWVVHTFNLKRLDRENMGGITSSIKRSYNQIDNASSDDGSETKAKKSKTVCDEEPSKRITKPVKRFDDTNLEIASTNLKQREVIVMKPVPWIRLNGSINRRVLDRWLGSILSECIARNGCSSHDICKRFSLFVPVDIFLLLEILCDLKCISLIYIQRPEVDVFSSYQPIMEKKISFIYDAENTYIKCEGDAVTRLSLFIGDKKYTTELI
ncbi:general transcription factor 3C polypeptide 1 isoform 1-T4 [Cochliomyia hominivorax]